MLGLARHAVSNDQGTRIHAILFLIVSDFRQWTIIIIVTLVLCPEYLGESSAGMEGGLRIFEAR